MWILGVIPLIYETVQMQDQIIYTEGDLGVPPELIRTLFIN